MIIANLNTKKKEKNSFFRLLDARNQMFTQISTNAFSSFLAKKKTTRICQLND